MAETKSHIKNLESLDKEILKLQLRSKNTAENLENNFDQFRKRFASVTLKGIFSHLCRKDSPGERKKEKIFDFIWKNIK